MNKTKYKRVIGALLALSAVSFGAQAANFIPCIYNGKVLKWPLDKTPTMHIKTVSMPEVSDPFQRTLRMMGRWNSVGGSKFKFGMIPDPDGRSSIGNDKSEIDFKYMANDALSVTYRRTECPLDSDVAKLIEADITINANKRWTYDAFTRLVVFLPFNFEIVMLHELGHVLGLGHFDDSLATMNSFYPAGGPLGSANEVVPHADDRYGLRILYPDDTSTERDLAVSRYDNMNVPINSVYLPNSWIAVRDLYKDRRYDIEYTVENLGTQPESANIKFCMSKDPLTDVSRDRICVAQTTLPMPAGSVVSAKKQITIPLRMPSGTYYIGYVVEADSIPGTNQPEYNQRNNSVSLQYQVTIQ